jgi:hypothetical protein
MIRFHDHVLPTGRTGEIARLIEAANDLTRAKGQERLLVLDDRAKTLVLDLFDPLHRAVDLLQVGAASPRQ